jgi:hypothetical protein
MPYADLDQQRAYQREWVARRRAEWLAANGPCVDCGSWKNLQLDHVDSSAKVSHRVWSWSRMRREAELAKCAVRCGPCHSAKTTAHHERPHGERNGQARVTERDVREIRDSAHTERALARQFGISNSAVHRIRARETWRHLEL